MRRNTALFAVLGGSILALLALPALALALTGEDQVVPGARALEGRLIAPCCWTQTLDIHDSPISEQLRAEISQRLRAGEPAAKIEDDLAARYGEQIRAVPRGEDPRLALPIIVGGAMALAAAWLAWIGIAWLKRSRRPEAASTPANHQQQYDRQLDDELKNLSDVS